MQNLRASLFFDADDVLTRTERLVLRRPIDEDLMKYIDAFGGACPLLAREYRRNEELRADYWKGVQGEDSLYCSICAKETGEFVGYCAIERLKSHVPRSRSICLSAFRQGALARRRCWHSWRPFGKWRVWRRLSQKSIRRISPAKRCLGALGLCPGESIRFSSMTPPFLRALKRSVLRSLGESPRSYAAWLRSLMWSRESC